MVDAMAGLLKSTLAERIVRYDDLVPCLNAFIDTRTPGSEQKENFTIIGPGVSENPNQYVHIAEPHGFNIGGARQPPHCVNSQHSHDTAEVFVVHSGKWRFDFGENGEDASLAASPGDIVSFPTHAFRGFTNIGSETGFLWSVLGGDDPGRVTWAPRVFEMARDYGLALLENGALIDTSAGECPPRGVSLMPPTSRADIAALTKLTPSEASRLVVRSEDEPSSPGEFANLPGVVDSPVIGEAISELGIEAAPLGWSHGFRVSRLKLEKGASIPSYVRDQHEVYFVQSGSITVTLGDETAQLNAGDTVTVPVGLPRSLESAAGALLFRVLGDHASKS
ncbi:cupin domain-containing protein [Nostoc sp. 3335mG]|nr:cupin domain-containing protein [Nostoc sp. 3335mG]